MTLGLLYTTFCVGWPCCVKRIFNWFEFIGLFLFLIGYEGNHILLHILSGSFRRATWSNSFVRSNKFRGFLTYKNGIPYKVIVDPFTFNYES